MNQKYTITVADMEMSVLCDSTSEQVEHIVGILDRKMREITLNSRRCPRTEAAVLCALEFCSDKLEAQNALKESEERLLELTHKLKDFEDKFAKLTEVAKKLSEENKKLMSDNKLLRDISAGISNVVLPSEPEFSGDQLSLESVLDTEDDSAKSVASDNAAKDLRAKEKSKSRVGSMFDLLTFTDIDD